MPKVQRYLIAPLLLAALLGGARPAAAAPAAGPTTTTITIDSDEIKVSDTDNNGVVVQDDSKDSRPTQVVAPPAAEGSYVLKSDGTVDVDDTMRLRHEIPDITNDSEIIVFPADQPATPQQQAAVHKGQFPAIPVTIYTRVKNYTMVTAKGTDHRHLLASRSGRRPVVFYTRVAEKVDIAPIILRYATQYNLDPYLVKAVIKTESAFSPRATSYCGAAGLMQLMPATGRRMGAHHLYDVEENIAAGTRYLHYLSGLFNNTEMVVAAYNAGEGAVQSCGGIPRYAETQGYVRKVMSSYRAYKSASEE